MIVFRYLTREVVLTMLAVTLALLVIVITGRFGKYLSLAASGDLAGNMLFYILLYRLPGFLELVLPLGLFLGILLAFGRLYVESEMTVLRACGIGPGRVLRYIMAPTMAVAVFVGMLSLWISPVGADRFDTLWKTQPRAGDVTTLVAGSFQQQRDWRSTRVSYTEELSQDRVDMLGVFFAYQRVAPGTQPTAIISAERGRLVAGENGERFIELYNGTRYEGIPGQRDYRITHFERFGQLVQDRPPGESVQAVDAMPTSDLLAATDSKQIAALQWRFSLPLLVPIVAVIALALSRTDHRRGRYGKLLPAILIYLVYLVLLSAARDAVAKGSLPPVIGLWGVHALFALLAAQLWFWPAPWRRVARE